MTEKSSGAKRQARYRDRQRADKIQGKDATKPATAGLKISQSAVDYSRRKPATRDSAKPLFAIPTPPPGVLPKEHAKLAMDQRPNLALFGAWAGGYYGAAFAEGMEFLGYPLLAEMAQRPEYRRIVEIIATEMTRKWIRLRSTGDEDKSDKIQKIEAELVRLEVQKAFKKIAEQDGFFGRAHLYLDTGATDDPAELLTSIGNGRDELSKRKVAKGSLKAVRAIEAVWTYPTNYNSNDPLKGDWYNPDIWFVMGKRIHASRLLPFIGREVPDLLKPAYSFGGLSLTQMAKPYVDNWLQTRQSVNDAISAFSIWVLQTDMAQALQVGGGEELSRRADLLTNYRNNRGLLIADKNAEDIKNVASPLADLDKLQAQAQEHMASVSGIPLLKLLGIQPAGLNATAEGELRSFYDWIAACQKGLFQVNLTKVIDFIQLSMFGEVDEEITFEFEPLWALNEKEAAEVKKIEAETAEIDINSGAIAPEERRQVIVSQPDSPYDGLDPDDAPNLLEEEEGGLEPKGSAARVAEAGEGDDPERKAA